jgi:epoxyqueuosine reductase
LTLKETIVSKSIDLGFSYCGFAKAEPLVQESEWLNAYLGRKPLGSMEYLSVTSVKRLDPRKVMDDVKTIIVLLMNYYTPQVQDEQMDFIIARYALVKDYHVVIKEKLDKLASFIKEEAAEIRTKTFVDSGPVMEKAWAQRSGTGWIGKNTLLINKGAGSFFFIGVILTSLELEPDVPEQDHCGTCRKCLDACPTGALEMPYLLNPGKCISFLTNEGENAIPEDLKDKFHNRVYGCDICQDACPYNKFATPAREPAFEISHNLRHLRKEDWLKMTDEEFNTIFLDKPVRRRGYEKVMRTVRFLENI